MGVRWCSTLKATPGLVETWAVDSDLIGMFVNSPSTFVVVVVVVVAVGGGVGFERSYTGLLKLNACIWASAVAKESDWEYSFVS